MGDKINQIIIRKLKLIKHRHNSFGLISNNDSLSVVPKVVIQMESRSKS